MFAIKKTSLFSRPATVRYSKYSNDEERGENSTGDKSNEGGVVEIKFDKESAPEKTENPAQKEDENGTVPPGAERMEEPAHQSVGGNNRTVSGHSYCHVHLCSIVGSLLCLSMLLLVVSVMYVGADILTGETFFYSYYFTVS